MTTATRLIIPRLSKRDGAKLAKTALQPSLLDTPQADHTQGDITMPEHNAVDELFEQAISLVSEDKRGELADIIESIIDQATAAPPTVHILAIGSRITDIVGVYASLYDLERHATQLRLIGSYKRGEFVVKGRQPTEQPI